MRRLLRVPLALIIVMLSFLITGGGGSAQAAVSPATAADSLTLDGSARAPAADPLAVERICRRGVNGNATIEVFCSGSLNSITWVRARCDRCNFYGHMDVWGGAHGRRTAGDGYPPPTTEVYHGLWYPNGTTFCAEAWLFTRFGTWRSVGLACASI